MNKKAIIGHVACPVCDFAEADVKEDKNGHAFIFCSDCAAQTFTRNEYRDKHLRRRMRPVTVTVTEPEPEPSPLPVPEPLPVPVAVTKPEPKKKGGWLNPIMAGGGA